MPSRLLTQLQTCVTQSDAPGLIATLSGEDFKLASEAELEVGGVGVGGAGGATAHHPPTRLVRLRLRSGMRA